MSTDLDAALRLVDSWPVESAGVAVVGVSGVLATGGRVDQVFELASVTKLITAMAHLVAVEEGTIALDDAVGPPGVTVAHLLAHASVLGPDDPTRLMAPVHRRVYSNAGFELVAAHLSERAGMPFIEYAAQGVLEPLGLSMTSLDGRAATGGRATVADLARLAAELLRPTLVSAVTLADATRPWFPDLVGVLPGFGRQTPCPWGLGFEIRGHKSPHWTGSANDPRTFGHFGQAGSFLWVDPVHGVALCSLSDRPFGPWAAEAWPVLADAVLAALLPTTPPPRPAPSDVG